MKKWYEVTIRKTVEMETTVYILADAPNEDEGEDEYDMVYETVQAIYDNDEYKLDWDERDNNYEDFDVTEASDTEINADKYTPKYDQDGEEIDDEKGID